VEGESARLLVDGVRAGDAAARERFAWYVTRLALRTAAATLGGRDGADDVAQEVAITALQNLRRLRDPERLDAWVHRIAVRHTLDALTRAQRSELRAEPPHGTVNLSESPESVASRLALRDALAALPPRQRIALALRYVHDLTDAEIANALGCRRGTANSLLSRGRELLRRDPVMAQFGPLAKCVPTTQKDAP
jgi:RNA polymerase sigma-70 factor (ECF subfamily)